jgi:hypothetical protein
MCIWGDNIKMYIRETSCLFNYALKQGQSGILGNVIDVILKEIYKYLEAVCN